MEGFLIRVPVDACFPDSRPAWRQRSDATGPVHSRVLYYVIEEGYLRGYESPDAVDQPVEAFQLTAHRIEVNAMYSLNIFELKARAVRLPPSRQYVEDTSSSSSDSEDDNMAEPTQIPMSRVTAPTTPGIMSGCYHVVFFAANKELVKKWSLKLLNWNRYVFCHSGKVNETGLELDEAEIIDALRVVNTADRFLRPVELRTTKATSTTKGDAVRATSPDHQVSAGPAPVGSVAITSSTFTPTESTRPAIEAADVVKPSSASETTNQWWAVPFGRSKRISSYSVRG